VIGVGGYDELALAKQVLFERTADRDLARFQKIDRHSLLTDLFIWCPEGESDSITLMIINKLLKTIDAHPCQNTGYELLSTLQVHEDFRDSRFAL
jgi:hypothetical protein